jgi:hypothetical protein
LIPLIIAGAAGLGSAIAGAVSSNKASKAQQRTAQQAMDLQRQTWEQQRADQAPWLEAGRASLADLMRQMQSGGFDNRLDPSTLANDPGFQFRMAEGQKALERSAAARGGLNSGGFMKGLARYSQGVASDEYQNAWARNESGLTNRFNRLASLAGVGQAAAQSLGGMGSQHAGNMGNLYGAIGNAQAAGAIGTGNAIGNTLGQVAGLGAASYLMRQQPQQLPTQQSQPQYTPGWGMPLWR